MRTKKLLFIVITVTTILYLTQDFFSTEPANASQSEHLAVSDQQKQVLVEWTETVLAPRITHLEQHYPVESVRAQLHALMEDSRSGNIGFTMAGKKHPLNPGAPVGTNFDNVEQPIIILHLPTLMEIAEKTSCEEFDDVLLTGLLHEYIGIQEVRNGRLPDINAQTREGEFWRSNVWCKTIKYVSVPMQQEGRPPSVNSLVRYGLGIYSMGSTSCTDPAWQNFGLITQ